MRFLSSRPKFEKAPNGLHGRYRKFKWLAWRPVWLRDDQRFGIFENVIRHENAWGWGFFDVWYTGYTKGLLEK